MKTPKAESKPKVKADPGAEAMDPYLQDIMRVLKADPAQPKIKATSRPAPVKQKSSPDPRSKASKLAGRTCGPCGCGNLHAAACNAV